ncbi:MAG: hypothetical protein OXC84_11735, partial [Gammaproteobacteria bacterium]|nr:hypothetical protein [Gammaproteobacteria bacterium]
MENLPAYVDVDSGKVVVEDHGVAPVPTEPAEFAADLVAQHRTDLKPLEITQPEDPSFEVEGNLIRWQKWQFRFLVQPVDGRCCMTSVTTTEANLLNKASGLCARRQAVRASGPGGRRRRPEPPAIY